MCSRTGGRAGGSFSVVGAVHRAVSHQTGTFAREKESMEHALAGKRKNEHKRDLFIYFNLAYSHRVFFLLYYIEVTVLLIPY